MRNRKSKVRYCNECQRKVTPEIKWGWGGFFTFGPLYLIYYWIFKPKSCPICNSKMPDD